MQKIDHYQILKSLGKGGMGEVFLVNDPVCKRRVALKKIRDEMKKHPVMKERFLREARVAAQLTHPSIIPIFSIDPSPEKTYYTMPYVEGETLKQILKQSCEEEKERGSSPSDRFFYLSFNENFSSRLRSDCLHPLQRDRSSGHQTGQHHHRKVWRGSSSRLGARRLYWKSGGVC